MSQGCSVPEGDRDDGGLHAVGDSRRSEELALALVLEAVDCLRQAKDLLGEHELCAALHDCAAALVEIERQFSPPRSGPRDDRPADD